MSSKYEVSGSEQFSGAEISCVLHATEDENKVLNSAAALFSISEDKFFFKRLEGHWGNPITYLFALLDGKEARKTALSISLALNSVDKVQLKNILHSLVDEKGNMYIRIDKQAMCRGKIKLSEFDAVRIKFKPVKTYRKISHVPDYKVILSLDE